MGIHEQILLSTTIYATQISCYNYYIGPCHHLLPIKVASRVHLISLELSFLCGPFCPSWVLEKKKSQTIPAHYWLLLGLACSWNKDGKLPEVMACNLKAFRILEGLKIYIIGGGFQSKTLKSKLDPIHLDVFACRRRRLFTNRQDTIDPGYPRGVLHGFLSR